MICLDLSSLPFRAIDPNDAPHTVLALGNFDGIHIGHLALLRECVTRAETLSEEGAPVFPGVWIFRDPPSDFLRTPTVPHLSSYEEKLTLFRESGIRFAWVGDFPVLSALSPKEFAELLSSECHCVHAVCGFNYSFGYRGEGTPQLLSEFLGGAISVIPSVEHGGAPVSSTRIRSLLLDGNVSEASILLGRPYALSQPVLHGKALGRTLSFPTANQRFPEGSVIPRSGIYAVTVHFPWENGSTVHYGVANVGLRPTVENVSEVNCETFIFDFSGDLYGKTIEIRFVKRLRDERKMSGIDELKETIANDVQNARRLFGI